MLFRSLRSIMEEIMIPMMYDIPSREDVAGLLITPECVTEKAAPKYSEKISVDTLTPATSGLLEE